MHICVNIGNTNIAWGVFGEGGLDKAGRVNSSDSALLAKTIPHERYEFVAVASVAPKMTRQIVAAMAAFQAPVMTFGENLTCDIQIECDEPEKVGADRLLNAIGAFERRKRGTVVVDVGTAITVNAVSDGGSFLGGAIAAGPSTMLDALHERTALLPKIELAKAGSALGRNTRGAMLSGAYLGAAGLIERLVSDIMDETGIESPAVITGGGAELLLPAIMIPYQHLPFLTLEGLSVLALRSRRVDATRTLPL